MALPSHAATTSKQAWVCTLRPLQSDALSSRHARAKLDRILTGEVLRQWRDKAAAVEAKGWAYSHALEGCRVDAVRAGEAPGTVRVTATLREHAELEKGGEGPPESYRWVGRGKVLAPATVVSGGRYCEWRGDGVERF